MFCPKYNLIVKEISVKLHMKTQGYMEMTTKNLRFVLFQRSKAFDVRALRKHGFDYIFRCKVYQEKSHFIQLRSYSNANVSQMVNLAVFTILRKIRSNGNFFFLRLWKPILQLFEKKILVFISFTLLDTEREFAAVIIFTLKLIYATNSNYPKIHLGGQGIIPQ